MKIGLCIGSGGSRGYAAIPIIQKLLNHNICFSAISGCSIGSILGSYLALFGNLDGLKETVIQMKKIDFLKLVDLRAGIQSSLIKGEKVRAFLSEHFFGNKTFEDTQKPLFIVATDLSSGSPVFFHKGYLIDAIMASIAIPAIFPPYIIDNNYYIDGGVTMPLPISILLENKMDKVIVINLNRTTQHNTDYNQQNFIDILLKSLGIGMELLCQKEKQHPNVFVIDVEFDQKLAYFLRFHDYQPYFELGEKTIENYWPTLQEWLKN